MNDRCKSKSCFEDIDLIMDEQNPVYQNVNIHRQRIMTVLDRALEKLCIAYNLDDLTKNRCMLVRDYLTEKDIKAIIDAMEYIRNVQNKSQSSKQHLMEKNTHIKFGEALRPRDIGRNTKARSRSMMSFSEMSLDKKSSDNSKLKRNLISSSNMFISKCITSSMMLLSSSTLNQQPVPTLSTTNKLHLRSYYSSILAKLHLFPEVHKLAMNMLNQKPVASIKYYVYLKSLRDYSQTILYRTQTENINYMKKLKEAYASKIEVQPARKVSEEILNDKLREKHKLINSVVGKIECEKAKQLELKNSIFTDTTNITNASEYEIVATLEASSLKQAHTKLELAQAEANYCQLLAENVADTKILRKRNQKLEVTLSKVLEDCIALTIPSKEYNELHESYLIEEAKYKKIKEKFDAQEVLYNNVLKRRKQYVDNRMREIRYNKSAKFLQRWWRSIRRDRKKWEKNCSALRSANVTKKKRN